MKVTLSRQATKALEKMDAAAKRRISHGIEAIPYGDIKPIKGIDNAYRLRIGDWRILFSRIDNDTIHVERIAPRGDVYKGV